MGTNNRSQSCRLRWGTGSDSDGRECSRPWHKRHTFACQWVERGGSLAALQQVLGHASIEMTQRYARLSDEAVMREAARIGEAGTGS